MRKFVIMSLSLSSFLICNLVYAGVVHKCDPATDDYLGRIADTISNYNLSNVIVSSSPCPPLSASSAECLVSGLPSGLPNKYLKCTDTDSDTKYDSIVEKSQSEKDAVDAAEASEADTTLRTQSKSRYDGQTEDGQVLRCLVKLMVDEFNAIRGENSQTIQGLNDRTLSQAKTAIKNCIDSGAVDE